tara:strand:- start:4 stop:585 length:582 start_codon:yes stop_codon:yes gene_type:complete
MNKEDLLFFANDAVQIDLLNFLFSFITVAILCFFIQLFYIKFSSTLSNRIQFSKIFVILGVTTCIVIMIVKNSLALSLGLVGALSIVRFRAAIKEPEELAYLFLVIAAGLGCGANQLKITAFEIILSLGIIYLYYFFSKIKKFDYDESLNVATTINLDVNTEKFDDLVSVTTLIKKEYKNSKVIIARNSDLSL